VFSTDNVVGNAPNEGAEGKKHDKDRGKGESAAALAVSPLISHHAKGSQNNTAGILPNGTVARSLFAGEGRQEIAVGRVCALSGCGN
jgi:hypothetical protein